MAVCLPVGVWDESKWGIYWCLILCIFETTCAAHWKIKLVLSVWNIIGKGLYVNMCNWLNSKLQAEFALSSFNLCDLVLPSGFPVLQDVGRDYGSSQWTQTQIILNFSCMCIHWGWDFLTWMVQAIAVILYMWALELWIENPMLGSLQKGVSSSLATFK